MQVERLQRERLVEADGADLLTHGTADNVCGCALGQESGRSDSNSKGCGLGPGRRVSHKPRGNTLQALGCVRKSEHSLGGAAGGGRGRSNSISGNGDDLCLICRNLCNGRSEGVGEGDHFGWDWSSGSNSSSCEGRTQSSKDGSASGAGNSNWILLTHCGELTDAGLAARAGHRLAGGGGDLG